MVELRIAAVGMAGVEPYQEEYGVPGVDKAEPMHSANSNLNRL